jgi:hypothetical protein
VGRVLRHRRNVLRVGCDKGILSMERVINDRAEWRETFRLLSHPWCYDGVNPYLVEE